MIEIEKIIGIVTLNEAIIKQIEGDANDNSKSTATLGNNNYEFNYTHILKRILIVHNYLGLEVESEDIFKICSLSSLLRIQGIAWHLSLFELISFQWSCLFPLIGLCMRVSLKASAIHHQ